MRVLFVSEVYPPETGWGGIGTYVHTMARGLAQVGHHVTVLCGYESSPSVQDVAGVRLLRWIDTMHPVGLGRSARIADLLEVVREQYEPDVVEFAEFGGDGFVFQQRNRRFPTVVKLHAPSRLCALLGAPPLKRAIRRTFVSSQAAEIDRMERASASMAHAVVSPSEWLVQTLQVAGWAFGSAPEIVPNPLSDSSETTNTIGRYSGADVLFLGRLAFLKGADLYQDIFRRVWREVPEARFHVVGQDSLRSKSIRWSDHIMKRVPDVKKPQVRFEGGVPHSQIPELLQRHSVAAFASRFENFPYALLECMHAGIACVVGAPGGAQEIGKDGLSTLNVPRRARAIAAGIVKLLKDSRLREMIGTAAKAQVRNFSTESVLPLMTHVYESAICRARKDDQSHSAASALRHE